MKLYNAIITSCLLMSSVALAKPIRFSEADDLTKAQLTVYLQSQGYVGFNENPVDALDDEYIEKKEVKIGHWEYDFISVYTGDNEHGPLLIPGTLHIVGGNSDGDFYLKKKEWVAQPH